jgi:hypothetical protein
MHQGDNKKAMDLRSLDDSKEEALVNSQNDPNNP